MGRSRTARPALWARSPGLSAGREHTPLPSGGGWEAGGIWPPRGITRRPAKTQVNWRPSLHLHGPQGCPTRYLRVMLAEGLLPGTDQPPQPVIKRQVRRGDLTGHFSKRCNGQRAHGQIFKINSPQGTGGARHGGPNTGRCVYTGSLQQADPWRQKWHRGCLGPGRLPLEYWVYSVKRRCFNIRSWWCSMSW